MSGHAGAGEQAVVALGVALWIPVFVCLMSVVQALSPAPAGFGAGLEPARRTLFATGPHMGEASRLARGRRLGLGPGGLRPSPEKTAGVSVRSRAQLPRLSAGRTALLAALDKNELKVIFPTYHSLGSIAIPIYERSPNLARTARLTIGNYTFTTAVLTDVEAVAFKYHKDHLPLIILKQAIKH